MRLFYWVATVAMRASLVALTRWRVEGRENVPRTGPLILVSNHLSFIDPPLLGASLPRRINFMTKQELFRSPISRAVVKAYYAFPVRRGVLDRSALRRALEVLKEGWVVGVFPEGRRSPDGHLQSPQAGASLLASRSGVPVLPVGIAGSERVKGLGFLLRRPPITVTIGRPFHLKPTADEHSRAKLEQQSRLIMERIAELLPTRYRGAYGPRRGSRRSDGD